MKMTFPFLLALRRLFLSFVPLILSYTNIEFGLKNGSFERFFLFYTSYGPKKSNRLSLEAYCQ